MRFNEQQYARQKTYYVTRCIFYLANKLLGGELSVITIPVKLHFLPMHVLKLKRRNAELTLYPTYGTRLIRLSNL